MEYKFTIPIINNVDDMLEANELCDKLNNYLNNKHICVVEYYPMMKPKPIGVAIFEK